MPVRRLLSALVILLALLSTLTGCRNAQPGASSQTLPNELADETPLVKPESEKGLLLKTGAVQLGPGVGRNAWRWQGDGEGGF